MLQDVDAAAEQHPHLNEIRAFAVRHRALAQVQGPRVLVQAVAVGPAFPEGADDLRALLMTYSVARLFEDAGDLIHGFNAIAVTTVL